jgi:DNA-binding NarL/FixJ family response regulator
MEALVCFSPSPTSNLGGIIMTTVAVVEDDALLRQSMVRLIGEASGFSCVGAYSTAEEALKKIPGLMPNVVVMDIHLPRMSGIVCASQLKEKCPAISVLMLTVYDDKERIFEALRAGASGYLLKRSVANEILAAISDVKSGGSPMSAHVARKVVTSFQQSTKSMEESSSLSERENEILAQLSRGYANKEIAERLHISLSTVRTHLRHIYEKLHVHSRAQALLQIRQD